MRNLSVLLVVLIIFFCTSCTRYVMVLPASGYTASAPQPTYAPVGNQSVAPQRPRRTISIQVSGGYNSGPYGGVRPGQPIYGQQPIRY